MSVPGIDREFDLNIGSSWVFLSCLYTIDFNDFLNESCLHFRKEILIYLVEKQQQQQQKQQPRNKQKRPVPQSMSHISCVVVPK